MSVALRESLAAWPDLWRRPALFRLIHGARQEDTAERLRDAMLEAETDQPHTAWQAILAGEDLAAAAAAYDRLAPELGIEEARRGLAQARSDFQRRVGSVRDRARPLPMAWAAVDRTLREAVAIHLAEPKAAEARLAQADSMVAEAERLELANLARHAAEDEMTPQGLRAALAAGDIRLAQILSGRTNAPVTAARPMAYDLRIEREPTTRLLEWRLAPELAPAWLPPTTLSENDVGLLTALVETMALGTIDAERAEDLLRRALAFLGSAAHDVAAVKAGPDEMWSFHVRGPDVAAVFPHASEDDGSVTVAIPHSGMAALPRPHDGRRLLAWDVFEVWRTDLRAEVTVVRPRMFLELLHPEIERRAGFVRLVSRGAPVRALILNVLGQHDERCRRFAGQSARGEGAAAVDGVLDRLIEALDLYVDEGDILALRDAYGGSQAWMLQALHMVAKALDTEPATNRRFDALRVLRRAPIARELEARLDESLAEILGEDRFATALQLDVLEGEFDSDDPGPVPMWPEHLATVLVREEQAADIPDALRVINDLVSTGLLRTMPSPGSDRLSISPSLPLPARLLLRA